MKFDVIFMIFAWIYHISTGGSITSAIFLLLAASLMLPKAVKELKEVATHAK